MGFKIGEVPIKTIYQDEKSSIPIFTASIKLIPTFMYFFYLRNVLNARFNLSINSIVFFLLICLIAINLFLNIFMVWLLCLIMVPVYLFIDIFNFYHNE